MSVAAAPEVRSFTGTFGQPIGCGRCHDLGLWLEPSGSVAVCPEIQIGSPHNEPSDAAKAIRRAVDSLKFRGIAVNSLAFAVARSLIYFDTARPCPGQVLETSHFTWTHNANRKLQHAIEELRSVWLLPVGSRKGEPSGYWIITDNGDFREWFERTKAAPITQLSTIHRVAKANFPVFAEQMEFEFWSDIQGDDEGADVTFADADI